ncbi:8-amino-7-oxononanoate synthase [Streptomyces badius]
MVSDAGNHASIVDGCRLSRAGTAVAPHADPEAVAKALGAHDGRALAVTDSVFSVDGDAAPLRALAEVCRSANAALLVDDAHGLGVLGDGGRGALAAAGLAGGDGIVATLTLSKSLGSQGGAVLGPARVIDHLVNTARTFIFDTGLAPAAVGGALGALGVLRREPERAAPRPRGGHRAVHAAHRRRAGGGPARRGRRCSRPGPVGGDGGALGGRLPHGRNGGALLPPPSVPDGISRLRLTARADLTEEQITTAVATIAATAPRQADADVS